MNLKTEFVVEEFRVETAEDILPILKALRHEKGYTQQHLADSLQLSQKTVSALERNAHKANFKSVVGLLDLLDAELIVRKRS